MAVISLRPTLDGYVRSQNASFIEAINATTGGAVSTTTSLYAYTRFYNGTYFVYHSFLSFDIPKLNSFLSAASLRLTATSPGGQTEKLLLVSSMHGTPLSMSDFHSFDTTELAQRVQFPAQNSQTIFVFNKDGLDYIENCGGEAKLCILGSYGIEGDESEPATVLSFLASNDNPIESYRPQLVLETGAKRKWHKDSGLEVDWKTECGSQAQFYSDDGDLAVWSRS